MIDLAGRIDHTLLDAGATERDVDRLCDEAVAYGCAAVCVNGAYVARAARRLLGSRVRTVAVVGFPLGAMHPRIKRIEAEQAVADGAREIDLVMNLGLLQGGGEDRVRTEIAAVVRAVPGARVKVILETGRLDDVAKVRAAGIAVAAGAAFVKTSTGFGTGGGATVADVRLLKDAVGARAGVKASGGIRDLDAALACVDAGADRLGTSRTVAILEELRGRRGKD